MSKTSLVFLAVSSCVITIILAVDNHYKSVKIDKLNNNIMNLHLENVTLKKNLAVAKSLMEYIGN